MNFPKNIQKNYIWGYLATGILMILLALLIQGYFSFLNQPKKISQKFQSILFQKEKKTNDELAFLVKEFPRQEFQKTDGFSNKYQRIFEKEGLAFFIYEKDSLVFWSTNAIPGIEKLNTAKLSKDSVVFRLQNGWYILNRKQELSRTFLGLILIEHCYPFNNEYLKNNFQEEFNVPEGTKITGLQGENTICSTSGSPLFSLVIPDRLQPAQSVLTFLFIFYIIGFFLILIFVYKLYDLLVNNYSNKGLLFAGILLTILILRLIQFGFRIPRVLYNSDLFGPAYFSSSFLLPSLGDLLVNSILFLFLAYVFLSAIRILVNHKERKCQTAL